MLLPVPPVPRPEGESAMARTLRAAFAALVVLALAREGAASPFAYVANEDTMDITVVDLATKSVRTTVTIGEVPSDVAVSPDGRTAYVSTDAKLFLVDTRTFAVTSVQLPQ